jgi:hypothetical protein
VFYFILACLGNPLIFQILSKQKCSSTNRNGKRAPSSQMDPSLTECSEFVSFPSKVLKFTQTRAALPMNNSNATKKISKKFSCGCVLYGQYQIVTTTSNF